MTKQRFPNIRVQDAQLSSPTLLGRIVIGIGVLMLLLAFLAASLWIALITTLLFTLGILLFNSQFATIAPGHWHQVRRFDERFIRYIGRAHGGGALVFPWEKIELSPFWVDHSIEINLKDIADLLTHDDMPFDLKGRIMLRFDPRLVAKDIKSSLPNHIRLDDELIIHAKMVIAQTVNQELIALGQRVTSARNFEEQLRTPDFRGLLSASIVHEFTPFSISKAGSSDENISQPPTIANRYGLVTESYYIRGQFGGGINRLRERLTGGAQGARLAQRMESEEDISLEDIALASGATQSYMKLRGFVSTDRSKQNRKKGSQQTQNTQQAQTQQPLQTQQPVIDSTTNAENLSRQEADMAKRIERLSGNPADIIREQRMKRNSQKDVL